MAGFFLYRDCRHRLSAVCGLLLSMLPVGLRIMVYLTACLPVGQKREPSKAIELPFGGVQTRE